MKTSSALTTVRRIATAATLPVAMAFGFPTPALASDLSSMDLTSYLGPYLSVLPQDQVMAAYATLGEVVETIRKSIPLIQAQLNELGTTIQTVMMIMTLVSAFLTALLAERLFAHHTAGAATMLRERPRAHVLSSLAGTVLVLLLIVLFAGLVFTLPLAGAILNGTLALFSVSAGFMGASLFKLVFKKLGRYKCAMAGGIIMGVVGLIPYLGIISQVIAFLYLMGYVVQSIVQNQKKKPEAAEVAKEAAEGAPESDDTADEAVAEESGEKAAVADVPAVAAEATEEAREAEAPKAAAEVKAEVVDAESAEEEK